VTHFPSISTTGAIAISIHETSELYSVHLVWKMYDSICCLRMLYQMKDLYDKKITGVSE